MLLGRQKRTKIYVERQCLFYVAEINLRDIPTERPDKTNSKRLRAATPTLATPQQLLGPAGLSRSGHWYWLCQAHCPDLACH